MYVRMHEWIMNIISYYYAQRITLTGLFRHQSELVSPGLLGPTLSHTVPHCHGKRNPSSSGAHS